MISFVCSTKEPKEEFKTHVIKMCGLDKNKVEFLFYENKGQFSLTSVYNRGLKESKNNIVVFLHDDIVIETKQFGNKILKHFNNNPEYGIIGVAGTNKLTSGQWWESKRNMMGIVNHSSDGKKWTSKYSNDIGNSLNEVIVLDGVFFAVDKSRLKENFDERFDGFHFYDISFCFGNFIKGVKLGVLTNIRITHFSIGMTNDKWLENKSLFESIYENNLPTKVNFNFDNKKIKVLIGTLYFKNYTGSELYCFELAKSLIKLGCDVYICSDIGEPLLSKSHNLGIKLYSLNEPPGFKIGDGKCTLNTPQGIITTEPNMLYKIEDISFDVLHLNHKPVTERLLKCYPNIPTVCTIHSEVISLEEPVINEQISKYITIRPEIQDYIIKKFNIREEKTKLIYNPIDNNRFKELKNKNDKNVTLFIGTIDYLRKNTILDLVEYTKNSNKELWVVGHKNDNFIDSIMNNNPHVKHFNPTYNVEKYVYGCSETAGILLGRTTIEGWLCGKGGWIYDVDNQGNIKSKTFHEVPNDIEKFKSENVAKEIIESYKEAINK